MSMAIYSCKSKTATRLKNKGIEISVDDDNDEQINITHDDKNAVKFNIIYNKDEIDELLKLISGAPANFNMFSPITPEKMMYGLTYNDTGHSLFLKHSLVENYKELYENVSNTILSLNTFFNFLDNSGLNERIGTYISSTALFEGLKLLTVLNKDSSTRDFETEYKKLTGNDAILSNVIQQLGDGQDWCIEQIIFICKVIDKIIKDLENTISCQCPDNSEEFLKVFTEWEESYTSLMNNIIDFMNSLRQCVDQLSFKSLLVKAHVPKSMVMDLFYPTSQANLLEDDIVDPDKPIIPYDDFVELCNKNGIEVYETQPSYDIANPVHGAIEIQADLKVNGLINGIDIKNITGGDTTKDNNDLSQLTGIEDRLKVLEAKCINIEGPTAPSGELTLDNLLQSYDKRLKVLEAKCANI